VHRKVTWGIGGIRVIKEGSLRNQCNPVHRKVTWGIGGIKVIKVGSLIVWVILCTVR
jgi:hypothetical protein